MMVLMAGGSGLRDLMRGDRPVSKHLAPAHEGPSGDQRRRAEAQSQAQRRLEPSAFRQHVRRNRPQEEDAPFR